MDQLRRPPSSSWSAQIPKEIDWALQVDGHTDVRPIASRAVPVQLGAVDGARDLGGPLSRSRAASRADRLVAAGYGRVPPWSRQGPMTSLPRKPSYRAEADEPVGADANEKGPSLRVRTLATAQQRRRQQRPSAHLRPVHMAERGLDPTPVIALPYHRCSPARGPSARPPRSPWSRERQAAYGRVLKSASLAWRFLHRF